MNERPEKLNDYSLFENEEVFPPRPTIPENDLVNDYPYGWVYVRQLGFFEVNCIGLHEWTLSILEGWLQGTEEAWLQAEVDQGVFAEKLLAREGVAYMSSQSSSIWVGSLKNLNYDELKRFSRNGKIKELL